MVLSTGLETTAKRRKQIRRESTDSSRKISYWFQSERADRVVTSPPPFLLGRVRRFRFNIFYLANRLQNALEQRLSEPDIGLPLTFSLRGDSFRSAIK
mmetsp:Transcript_39137/g.155132  ORF Transcript_39137/g.155132 Transcript_39137/m.155132 type:complete len:98 (+) Transcript_39137:3503-3796(+)